MDTTKILLTAGVLVLIAAVLFFTRKIKREIEENGIETWGVISRIVDEGTGPDININYYARYVTADGKEVEGVISNPDTGLTEGQRVRLKYHPKYTQNARLIRG
ncbi:MAG: hypothetical protein IK082_01525 [Oscillospiraceae bacterium]|nr:hypothetical protein [Oscillospiraceae bacterium]